MNDEADKDQLEVVKEDDQEGKEELSQAKRRKFLGKNAMKEPRSMAKPKLKTLGRRSSESPKKAANKVKPKSKSKAKDIEKVKKHPKMKQTEEKKKPKEKLNKREQKQRDKERLKEAHK